MESIEIRCPVGPRRLLSKLLVRGESPTITDNLIEFACDDCKQNQRRLGRNVKRVLHRYDLAGVLVETLLERSAK
jgi:hypothetical protein